MSSENSWKKKLVPPPPLCTPSTAAFNWKDRSISFLPSRMPRSEFNIVQGLRTQYPQILNNEWSTNQHSLPVTRHLPGSESRIIPGLHPIANQLFVNEPNISQNLNLSQHQVSSNRAGSINALNPPTDRMLVNKLNGTAYLQHHQLFPEATPMIQDLHPAIAFQLSANEYPSSRSQSHQLPSNGIGRNQNSNMPNQQLSQVKCLPTHEPHLTEFLRNQVKYPAYNQQSERESVIGRVKCHSEDELGMLQNQFIPSQQSGGKPASCSVSTNFPKMGFNINKELPISGTNSQQNLYMQYSEKVYICVIGPPASGKGDLIRTYANKDDIRISTDKALSWVFQQGLVSFGTTLEIDIWYGEDLTSAADDLRSLCQSSRSAIVLVYNVAQKITLLTVLEWIKILKSDMTFNVPIILVGNTTDVDSSCASRQCPEINPNLVRFSDGFQAKEEYDLAGFFEYSVKCVKDAEIIFLIAAYKAFNRKIQKSVRVW